MTRGGAAHQRAHRRAAVGDAAGARRRSRRARSPRVCIVSRMRRLRWSLGRQSARGARRDALRPGARSRRRTRGSARSPSSAAARADREGARVPERIEQARARAELAEALLAPGEVIAFLARGLAAAFPRGCRAGHQGLAVIERLGGDLAGMVDPHQAGHVAPLRLGELGGAAGGPRGGPARPGRRETAPAGRCRRRRAGESRGDLGVHSSGGSL